MPDLTSLQESIDQTQLSIARGILDVAVAIAGGRSNSPSPITISKSASQQNFQKYSSRLGTAEKKSLNGAKIAARLAHKNGESANTVISLVRHSPAGESIAKTQGPQRADVAAAQVGTEAIRINVVSEQVKNNPQLRERLQARANRVPKVRQSQ